MKKVILIILLISVILLFSTCAKRKEGRCKLRHQKVDISETAIYFTCQIQSKLSEKPAQFKDLPKKTSNRVNYFLAKIAGKEIPLMIDRGRKSRLYLDTDADGYLSEERSFNASKIKEHLFGPVDYHRFGPIPVKFEQATEKFTQHIYVFTRDDYMRRLILCPAVYRKGRISLDGILYEVRIVDGNFDGKYDEIFSLPIERLGSPVCDYFAIDLNRNGKLDFNYYYHSELMPLSKMVKVGNSYYSINVAEGGESLELSKIQPDCGTLDFGNVNVKLKLWSNAAQQYFSNIGSNVEIPTGMYQALFVELSQIDSERNAWTFTCYRDTGALRNFKITKDKTTSFKIGPPFQIKTTARQIRETVNIDFTLVGQAGEQYRPELKRNGRRVSPPELRVIDEHDNVVYSGLFKYG